ncbi:hypothetical protein E2562_013279 [Oryza meyeriana var. granulata]|uniref:RING-type domain-containing protein n=1 Tax=Oryza meyeriana var. granulata TaxID=110450 RepID=A0A6G1D2H6_9ORYZ|nr:hypothetical protein E2562_013279 [Oryza meyeriana var. granulata]
MAQLHVMNDDDHHHSHVVDIDAADAGHGCRCAVCIEPLEWAAIGPCGHGDVCPGCSLHIRVFLSNRLCCICRALCRIVVFEGRVGEYWYHAGMEAFFDDERQYSAVKAAARLGPPPCDDANENPPPPPPRTGVSNSSHGRRSRRDPPPDGSCCMAGVKP